MNRMPPNDPTLRRAAVLVIAFGLALTLLAAPVPRQTSEAQPAGSRIALLGTRVVGGRVAEPATAEGTRLWIEQSQVHFLIPEVETGSPIVMVPGMNLGSIIFRSTPDGRKGWAQHFAEAGHAVYAFDDPLNSASGGFDINPFNEVKAGSRTPAEQAELSIWDMTHVWPRWGFGPDYDTPHPDVRFPVEAADQFYATLPFVHQRDGGGRGGSGLATRNLVALLDQIEAPVALLAHSAGASTALAAAEERPENVEAFVLVEPAGGIPDGADWPDGALLGVYGDYIPARRQSSRKQAVAEAVASFRAAGNRADLIDLPEDHGIRGNTHLLMQDDNNLEIADMIIEWLREEPVSPLWRLNLPQLLHGEGS